MGFGLPRRLRRSPERDAEDGRGLLETSKKGI